MKERPILFSGPMVRALLSGAKTQTRRVVKLADLTRHPDNDPWYKLKVWSWRLSLGGMWTDQTSERLLSKCPYGQPGDRLWVREAWRTSWVHDGDAPSILVPEQTDIRYEADGYETLAGAYDWSRKIRPSLFMPRWASRITLEVTGVRVERLQDISEEDAMSEGVESFDKGFGIGWKDYQPRLDSCYHTAKGSYKSLWQSINGPDSWDLNPYVWVIEFKRVKP